jgi:SulP family sulfate permease
MLLIYPKLPWVVSFYWSGYNLVDVHHIKQVIKSSNKETIVLGITFFGTLFFELQFAILSGIIASLYFYLERTSKPNIAVLGINAENKFINIIREPNLKECSNLKIVRIDGSLYFASIETISDFFSELYEPNQVQNILIVSNSINFIDLGAAEWLTTEVEKWQKTRGGIYFSGPQPCTCQAFRKSPQEDATSYWRHFVNKNGISNVEMPIPQTTGSA